MFAVPEGESIEFSSAGILAALQRLELVVHPLAVPGDKPTTGSLGDSPFILLPGGLIAQLEAEGPLVVKAAAKQAVDISGAEGLAFQARELRRARVAFEMQTGVALTRAAAATEPTAVPEVTIGDVSIEARPFFGVGGLIAGIGGRLRPRRTLSRPPAAAETAIEAPFRLVISPSKEARWAHANDPVPAADEPHHVELWHSRLGAASENPDGTPAVDEQDDRRRIVRAVWARDREISITDWESNLTPKHEDEPFRMSLDPADRNMLVRQSAESWPDADGQPIAPVPVAATRLWLSALGAWLDLHGAWTTKPYSLAAMTSILAWDEIAPMGRDQYVRVVYPGYLYPLGHQAALVKVTERKLKDVSPSVAGLYQRKFLVIGEPVRTYADTHDFPFIRVGIRPLVTPPLDDPGNDQNSHFWPSIDGSPFGFILDALDQESRPVRLVAPLLWVAEQYGAQGAAQRKDVKDTYDQSPNRKVPALGQKVAFGPVRKGGDTVLGAQAISLTGDPAKTDSRPRMSQADVLLPAVQQLSGVGPVPISYNDRYKAGGFTAANNTGELWATVADRRLAEGAADRRRDRTAPARLRLERGRGQRQGGRLHLARPADPRALAQDSAPSATSPGWRPARSTRQPSSRARSRSSSGSSVSPTS